MGQAHRADPADIRYRFTGEGQILVDTEFRPGKDLPAIRRIGYPCELPSRTPLWKWYGNGPHENYTDRKSCLGGTNSWGATALPQYLFQADKTSRWSFLLTFEENPAPPAIGPRPR